MKRRAKRPIHTIIPKQKTIRLGEIASQFDTEIWKAHGETCRVGDSSFVCEANTQDQMVELLMGVLARHVGKKIGPHGSFKAEALPHVCYPIKGEDNLMEFWHRPQWPKAKSKPPAKAKSKPPAKTETNDAPMP